jgi:hypothetical protein
MGEIKSTLDLVLEKTRHLSQTDEEKQVQKQKDIANRLNGLLQQYQDRALSLTQLQRAYENFKTKFDLTDHSALADQIIRRLDPDVDNRELFEVLEHSCQLNYSGLAEVIHNYQAECREASHSRMEPIKERLAREYHISGSAVVPNLDSDEQWRLEAQKLRSEYEEKIAQERVKMLGKKKTS